MIKKYKKRMIWFFLVLFFFLEGTSQTAYAKTNHVTEIVIEVVLRDDGSASITQHWTGEFETGTENYIPIRTAEIGISEFAVSDENGSYLFVTDWEVEAAFEEKKGKCGIVTTKEGVELCFGITEYGHKEYTISYVVTDFIKGYTDYNGTNFMLINPEMSTFPTEGKITLRLENGIPLDSTNAGIWAFGFEGMAEFADGCAVAYTQKDLQGSDSMIVMLQLDRSLLSPETVLDQSFETVKERAFEDSSYGTRDWKQELKEGFKLAFLLLAGIMVVVVAGAALIIVASCKWLARREEEIEEFNDTAEYFKEIPNQGNLELTCYLAKKFDLSKDKQILGALMVSMMNQRSIEFGRTRTVDDNGEYDEALYLVMEPEGQAEKKLFQLMSKVAGENGRIEGIVLTDYIFDHYSKLYDVLHIVQKNGKRWMKQHGGFKKRAGNSIHHLSEKGRCELAQVFGLKKYLEEKNGMETQGLPDNVFWSSYMVYAALFDMEHPVMEKLNCLYPECSAELTEYHHRSRICRSYYSRMHSSMRSAARIAGGGGSSSRGGGRGHSGGGHGGGSR